MKRLYIMDPTTISLFKNILRGVGRNPKTGKKKGGIKAHTIINACENIPCLIRFSEAIRHDRSFMTEIFKLASHSIITFDRGYVDYFMYQRLTELKIWYVRLKSNTRDKVGQEFDIPDECDSGVLKDEEISLEYGINKEHSHRARRIAYWDSSNKRLFEFVTNNFELSAEDIALIYKKRWQIELLFKQLKQNFPLKYFLGESSNAIEIQIWVAMLANLISTLVRKQVKRKWAFSNLVSIIRHQLICYVNIYKFLEEPEACWKKVSYQNRLEYQNSLFPEMKGAYF
ncbi:MAG: IS4 family transposase [Mangrovibacterium sp.]